MKIVCGIWNGIGHLYNVSKVLLIGALMLVLIMFVSGGRFGDSYGQA